MVKRWSLSNSMEFEAPCVKQEFNILPPHLYTPSSSRFVTSSKVSNRLTNYNIEKSITKTIVYLYYMF